VTGTPDRRPWWFSGDDEQDSDGDRAPRTKKPVVSEESATSDESATSEESGDSPGMDWSTLMAGAQRMVDWATEKVMAPHAEHDDPAEHPQCMVCRTILLVGDRSGLGTPMADNDPTVPTAPHVDRPAPIQWIPIRD
jgi:hypothetical protein